MKLIFLLFVGIISLSAVAVAPVPPLTRVGQSFTYNIDPKKPAEFFVRLKAGDFVNLEVKPDETAVQVEVTDPQGVHYGSYPAVDTTFMLAVAADRAGAYRFTLSAPGDDESAEASVQIKRLLTQDQRINLAGDSGAKTPGNTLLESLRAKLKRAKKAQRSAALAAFWAVVGESSTPLIEEKKDDNKNMAVTFLWRAIGVIKNVVLTMPPWNRADWSDMQMEHIDGTDVWYKTLSIPKDARIPYRFAPNVPLRQGEMNAAILRAAERSDLLNPHYRFSNPLETKPQVAAQLKYSVLEMPKAPAPAWVAKMDKVVEGKIETRQLHSEIFKNDRTISIYLPVGFSAGAGPYDFAIIFDRQEYMSYVPTPQILDNLVAGGQIHPLVTVLVEFPGAEERSAELACNRQFSDFLSNELIPFVRNYYPITKDPARTLIAGSGKAGLAAACAGLHHPEAFGNILSQSGEFGWNHLGGKNAGQPSELLEPNELALQFARARVLPLRFYLDAGTYAMGANGIGGDSYFTSQHLRDVLIARGYEVHWQQYSGSNDYLNWRGTLGDGLQALLGVKQAAAAEPGD